RRAGRRPADGGATGRRPGGPGRPGGRAGPVVPGTVPAPPPRPRRQQRGHEGRQRRAGPALAAAGTTDSGGPGAGRRTTARGRPMSTVLTVAEVQALARSLWTEAQFTRQVIALAKLHAWTVCHFRAARTRHSWRTPVQGDGKGWPDLVLLKGQRVLWVELKTASGRLTPDQ